MRVTLDKIEHAPFSSQETECFRAIVCIDGEPMGTAQNSGRGEMTFIQPNRLASLLERHVKALPPHVFSDGESMPMTADMLIDDLLADHLLRKEMRKILKTKILFTRPGDDDVYATKHFVAARMALYAADQASVKQKLGADRILNYLGEDAAFALFQKGTKK